MTLEPHDEAYRRSDGEARRRATHERLGGDEPTCCLCGCGDSRMLTENHHIAGRRCSDETVTVCLNCHRRLSDAQRDHPVVLSPDPVLLERLAHAMVGRADLFAMLALHLHEEASGLLLAVKDCPPPWGRGDAQEKP